jgi:methylmalonyl-CoA/ethylmalonyl-CoA epimerase
MRTRPYEAGKTAGIKENMAEGTTRRGKDMTNDELRERNKNRTIAQIGFLVYDLEEAMQKWIDYLSIGPWKVLTLDENNTKEVIEKGRSSKAPFKFRVATAMVGETQIELIQPCYGVAMYEDWMKKHGEGFSHMKECVSEDDANRMTSEYAEKGVAVTRAGDLFGVWHKYFDLLDSVGFVYEIGNRGGAALPEDLCHMYTYPKENG